MHIDAAGRDELGHKHQVSRSVSGARGKSSAENVTVLQTAPRVYLSPWAQRDSADDRPHDFIGKTAQAQRFGRPGGWEGGRTESLMHLAAATATPEGGYLSWDTFPQKSWHLNSFPALKYSRLVWWHCNSLGKPFYLFRCWYQYLCYKLLPAFAAVYLFPADQIIGLDGTRSRVKGSLRSWANGKGLHFKRVILPRDWINSRCEDDMEALGIPVCACAEAPSRCIRHLPYLHGWRVNMSKYCVRFQAHLLAFFF